jgi:hypothetical protein
VNKYSGGGSKYVLGVFMGDPAMVVGYLESAYSYVASFFAPVADLHDKECGSANSCTNDNRIYY